MNRSQQKRNRSSDNWDIKTLRKLWGDFIFGKNYVRPFEGIRTSKAVDAKLRKIIRNFEDNKSAIDQFIDSLPSREGKEWSRRDSRVLKMHLKFKILGQTEEGLDYIAYILRRSLKEVKRKVPRKKTLFDADVKKVKNKMDVSDVRIWTTDEDLLMAHRYLYYVMKTPILPDSVYDEFEKEALEFGSISENSPVRKPGSDNKRDYPRCIAGLAMYLGLKKGGI